MPSHENLDGLTISSGRLARGCQYCIVKRRPNLWSFGVIVLPCLAWVAAQTWTRLHQAVLCVREYEQPPPGMVFVPAGKFWMGSDDPNAESNERPLRRVF